MSGCPACENVTGVGAFQASPNQTLNRHWACARPASRADIASATHNGVLRAGLGPAHFTIFNIRMIDLHRTGQQCNGVLFSGATVSRWDVL